MTQIKLNAAARIQQIKAAKFKTLNPKFVPKVKKVAKTLFAYQPEITGSRELPDGWEGSFHTETSSYQILKNLKKYMSNAQKTGETATSVKFRIKMGEGSILDLEVMHGVDECTVKIRETTA